MQRGLIFNVQRYSLHDGPGIRTTVFLKGCPLSCAWCHNPESQAGRRELQLIETRCIRCGSCLAECPQRQNGELEQTEAVCTQCGACVAACPTGARQMIGQEMSVDEVVHEVLRDRQFFDQSGGGVTLSGGEPLAQPQFTSLLSQALRDESVHTALDTCGYASRPVLMEVARQVDLVLYDLKSVDTGRHQQLTGVPCEPILDNLKALGSVHDNIWIRIPLIPGFNLDREQLEAAARFLVGVRGVKQVNLLPYHRLGTHKRQPTTRGRDGAGEAEMLSADEITREQLDEAADLFRAAGLHTLIGG